MHIRFNRSAAVREGYRLYDLGRNADVIRHCTAALAEPSADPELRLLRGVAYLNQNVPADAIADWEACCDDPHVAGIAWYELGNLLSVQGHDRREQARRCYAHAVENGLVEGHIGLGYLLLNQACAERDAGEDSVYAADLFLRVIEELTHGLSSPCPASQMRALSLRASAYYNFGDMDSFVADKTSEQAIDAAAPKVEQTDPRATGASLFS
jgi:hypothetical protein